MNIIKVVSSSIFVISLSGCLSNPSIGEAKLMPGLYPMKNGEVAWRSSGFRHMAIAKVAYCKGLAESDAAGLAFIFRNIESTNRYKVAEKVDPELAEKMISDAKAEVKNDYRDHGSVERIFIRTTQASLGKYDSEKGAYPVSRNDMYPNYNIKTRLDGKRYLAPLLVDGGYLTVERHGLRYDWRTNKMVNLTVWHNASMNVDISLPVGELEKKGLVYDKTKSQFFLKMPKASLDDVVRDAIGRGQMPKINISTVYRISGCSDKWLLQAEVLELKLNKLKRGFFDQGSENTAVGDEIMYWNYKT